MPSSGLCYFGTSEDVRLGDRTRYVAFFVLRLEGVVCYVPGVSPKHRDMEYDGFRHIGLQLRSGEVRQLLWAAGETTLGRGVTLVGRDAPFKPLDPKVQLDPTNEDWDDEQK